MRTLFENFNSNLIIRLLTEKNEPVYMSINSTCYLNEERYIVIVKSTKIRELWKNEPNPLNQDLNLGDNKVWIKDKKYNYASDGFSKGKINPVPLAKIVCNKDKKSQTYISFIDGTTRTMWLLVNGVKYFPIECQTKNEALLLKEEAGYNNIDIYSTQTLLNYIINISE